MTLLKALCINQKVTLRWDCENYICQEVSKMGSKLLATEYTELALQRGLSGQWHILCQKRAKYNCPGSPCILISTTFITAKGYANFGWTSIEQPLSD